MKPAEMLRDKSDTWEGNAASAGTGSVMDDRFFLLEVFQPMRENTGKSGMFRFRNMLFLLDARREGWFILSERGREPLI